MSLLKKMIQFSTDRVRGFSVLDMGLFKLTMFFLGVMFAISTPRFCMRNKRLIAVITAILTGTFLGYFFFGERYFELDSDGEAVVAKKNA